MGAFDKYSNFNTECNFIGVQFGERQPVLEVELNELQDIQNEARADLVRESIPSGFSTISPLNYDYMAVNENTLAFKEDSVAYVNGYRIKIPKGTVVDLGKAPEGIPREDLVFLEVWKEAVGQTSTINKEGGEGQPEVPNHIKDNRYPTAMSQRVQIKWRIRVANNANFTIEPYFNGLAPSMRTPNFNVQAQGGNTEPLKGTGEWTSGGDYYLYGAFWSQLLRDQATAWSNSNTIKYRDEGLFISGDGRSLSKSKLKTFDGYSYAIPMFRLFRKPSSGKARPNEYQKLHPEVNPFAFSERVKGEKVEKCEEVYMKGRTLHNVTYGVHSKAGSSQPKVLVNTQTEYVVEVANQGSLVFVKNAILKDNCDYTVICEAKLNKTVGGLKVAFYDGSKYTIGLTEIPISLDGVYHPIIQKITTSSSCKGVTLGCHGDETIGSVLGMKNLILLEGDWTNKEIPREYFEGIKSIGENELVTLKSTGKNLIDISKVKDELGYNTITHIPNGIEFTGKFYVTVPVQIQKGKKYIAKMDSEYISGFQSSSSIKLRKNKNNNKLPYMGKDTVYTADDDYDEVLLYNNMSNDIGKYRHTNIMIEEVKDGVTSPSTYEPYKESKQTLCLKEPLRSLPNGVCDEIIGNKIIRRVGKIVLDGNENWTLWSDNTSHISFYMTLPLQKGGTKVYHSDKFSHGVIYNGAVEGITSGGSTTTFGINILKSKLNTPDPLGFKTWLKANPTTVLYELATPYEETLEESMKYDGSLNRQFRESFSGKETLRELPNGVKDTIENGKIIRRVGKVVLDETNANSWRIVSVEGSVNVLRFDGVFNTPTNKLNTTPLSNTLPSSSANDNGDYEHLRLSSTVPQAVVVYVDKSKLSTQDVSGFTKWLQANPVTVFYELATPVEIPVEVLDYNYNTRKPLLELPNGVKDEIVGNKVMRRLDKKVLDGSNDEGWILTGGQPTDSNYIRFACPVPLAKINSKSINTHFINVENLKTFMIVASFERYIHVVIEKSKLSSNNAEGFKTWLKSNPTTIIYELQTPYEEYITPDNCNYYPVTENHNEYYGGLYYQEGVNYTEVEDTIIEPEIVEVNTFRRILPKGKTEIIGCKSKKHPEGYENVECSQNKNLVSLDNLSGGTIEDYKGMKCYKYMDNADNFNLNVECEPDTQYTVTYKILREDTQTDRIVNLKMWYSDGTYGTLSANQNVLSHFTTPKGKTLIKISGSYNYSNLCFLDLESFQLEKGTQATSYEPFIKGEKTIPVIKENDVESLQHQVSLTGFDNEALLNKNFDLFLRGDL